MGLFDTHAHILDEQFDGDRETLLGELPIRGIEYLVSVACNPGQFEQCIAQAEEYDYIYAAVGIHPHEAEDMVPEDLEKIRKACQHEKVVAVGEIGLDYYYDYSPREIQKKCFEEQLALAKEVGKPAIMHIRNAYGDALEILKTKERPDKGVIHCFSGSYESAKICLDMGYYISFAGTLTFDNATRLREIAQKLPRDRVVIETDCPYLAPNPMRGKRTDPGFVIYTAKKLSEIWEMDLYDAIDMTMRNGKELFGIGG